MGELSTQIEGAHQIAAMMLGLPELALHPDEAKALAKRIGDVAKHYNVPILAPKYAVLVSLVATAGTIYYPRAVAILARARAAKARDVTPQQ